MENKMDSNLKFGYVTTITAYNKIRTKDLEEKLRKEIYEELSKEIYNKLYEELSKEIYNKLYEELSKEIYDKLYYKLMERKREEWESVEHHNSTSPDIIN
jgi:hypothetical protein